MEKKDLQLSIVLPTYNERENIRLMIPAIEKLLQENSINGEIIIVDDSSPDGTAQLARQLNKKFKNIRVIGNRKKEGIGSALRVGYSCAKGKYILSSDSDMSFKVRDMLRLIHKLEEGFDLVVGSRHLSKDDYKKPNWKVQLKGLISYGGNKIIPLLTGIHIHDFSANFRIIRRDVWRSLRTFETTNAILLETIMKTAYKGYRIAEIPVVFKDRLYGESKLNLFIEIPKFLLKLFLFLITLRILRKL